MAYEACIDEIQRASGYRLSDGDVEWLVEAIAARANLLRRRNSRPGASDGDLIREATTEITAEATAAALILRRNAVQNAVKRQSFREYVEAAPAVPSAIPGKKPTAGPLVGLEARLVGVNSYKVAGGRASIDADGRTLERDYAVGLVTDLDRLGLRKSVMRGDLDQDIARELHELTRVEDRGAPGVTNNPPALDAAKAIFKYMRLAVDRLNEAGAWIGQYDGYIARTFHNSDRMLKAGFATWRDRIRPLLDERTFEDVDDIDGFLGRVYENLVSGIHHTPEGTEGFKNLGFRGPSNLAKRLSQSRRLHFRDADAWMAYREDFGHRGALLSEILNSLHHAARNTALMRVLGTNPRAELRLHLDYLKDRFKTDSETINQLKNADGKAADETSGDGWLWWQMDELDGRANSPVSRQKARIGRFLRSVEVLSKLGGITISAFGDIGFKARELRSHGVGFLEAYADGISSLIRGRGRRETREMLEDMRAFGEGWIGQAARRFDGEDAPFGVMAKTENTFYRATGIVDWTERQRAGLELVASRQYARYVGRDWARLPEVVRRQLSRYDIDGAEWNAVRVADMRQANGRKHLTPDVALRADATILEAWLQSRGAMRGAQREAPGLEGPGTAAVEAAIEKARVELARKFAVFYSDSGLRGVPEPGARERAIMRRGTRPGTGTGELLRSIMQFKAFPITVISKVWGGALFGEPSNAGKVAGIVHTIVAVTVLGFLSNYVSDTLKGRKPRDPRDARTWSAAFLRGGGAGIYGDFLFGELSQTGRTLLEQLGGPVLSSAGDIWMVLSRVRSGDDASAQALRVGLAHAPYGNFPGARTALDYLILYQIQETMNPGFLRRFERNLERRTGQTFIMPPSRVIPRGGGNRLFEGVRP